ncbi:MAG: hypothetical protein FJ146_07625 [Deltaproteobacteria bacterium]|nr:hypothetical protein [Deltaproteobacteria bacterium]
MTNQMNIRVLRSYVGGFAWPTLALAVGTWSVFGAACYATLVGVLPPLALLLVATVCNLYSFTVFHEAAHENIEGKGRGGWLTAAIGAVAGVMFMAPFAAVRRIHLTHHQHTNDPANDPDHWVATKNPVMLLLRCATIYPRYLYCYLVKIDRPRTELMKEIVILLGLWITAVAALSTPWADVSLYGFMMPSFLGMGFTAFFLDWLPHHPHQETSPVSNTRNFPSRFLSVILVGHNVHGVHHLNPRIPFYRCQRAYDAATAPLAPSDRQTLKSA